MGSGWKPVPISSRLAILPVALTFPAVGWVIRISTFSKDVPA